jgi:6,7-dimethyl-8-ribityllumazine synthase
MIARSHIESERPAADGALARGVRVLIIEAPYYAEISELLSAGARDVLNLQSCTWDQLPVPGALEIPQAFATVARSGEFGPQRRWQGVIALGCVIRGETSHYDIVCNMANHWLMHTALENVVPVGNAILTVDTYEQARARASGEDGGKGAHAARACLRLIAIADALARDSKGRAS